MPDINNITDKIDKVWNRLRERYTKYPSDGDDEKSPIKKSCIKTKLTTKNSQHKSRTCRTMSKNTITKQPTVFNFNDGPESNNLNDDSKYIRFA